MKTLIQTNIVNVFSIIDLQPLERPLAELYQTLKGKTDDIESAQAPNLLGYFNNKEKIAVVLTNNKLRIDNNKGDESNDFIDEFFKVFNEIKKISNPQSLAYGFNFLYANSYSDDIKPAKLIKNKFIKVNAFPSKLRSSIKGAGARLIFEENGAQYDLRIDPVSPDSNTINIQINANHNGILPSLEDVKTSFREDLKFIKTIVEKIDNE